MVFSTILQQGGIPPIRVNAQRRGSDKVLISRLITWTYLTNWTFDKLWPFGVSAISDVCPMSFRLPPDLDPMNFDDFSIQIRHFFDLFWFISVGISNSPLTNYRLDYVGQCLNFPCYVNRGLWDAIPLPRTMPDKHVELSSVCDCVGLCVVCQDSIGGTLTGQSRSSWVRDSDVKGDQDNKWCRSKQAKINYSKERFEDGLRWRSTAKQ